MDAIHRSAGKIPQKSKKRLTTKKELNIIAIETMAKGAKMKTTHCLHCYPRALGHLGTFWETLAPLGNPIL